MICQFYCQLLGEQQKKKLLLSALSGLVLEAELGEPADCFAEAEANYTIIRPTILATVLQADSAIMNSFSAHLLSGKSLSYNCPNTAFVMKTVVTSSSFSVPISRGCSRISTVFFSFFTGGENAKEVTTYNHPLAGAAPSAVNDRFRSHLTLGSYRTPVFSVEGVAEHFHRLRVAATVLDHGSKSIDISPHDYRSTKGIFAVNLEKVIQEVDSDTGHTGLSSKGGSLMTLQLEGCPQNADGTPVMLHICVMHDTITSLSAAGVIQME